MEAESTILEGLLESSDELAAKDAPSTLMGRKKSVA